MDIGFAIFFLCFSSLSAFQQFPLPFTSVFPVYPSFCFAGLCIVTCGSPFSSPFRLVRSCFFRRCCHSSSGGFPAVFSGLCFILMYLLRFFRLLRFLLLLPVFLRVFLHAAAMAAPSSLPPRFRILQLRLLLPVFIHIFLMLRFAFVASPAVFLAEGSPDAVPRGSGCCASLSLCSIPIDGLSPNAFVYHRFVSSGCDLSLGVCPSLCLFEVFFAPASVPPQPVCLALFCVTIIVPMMFLTRSDLRFLSQRGLPLGRSGLLRPLLSWFSGCLHVVVSILCISQFRSSASFTSKVLFVTWSPFGMSLACFGALSSSGFWFSSAVVPFSYSFWWHSPFFRLFLGIFPRLQISVSTVSLPL